MRSNSTLFRAGVAALILAALALSGCGKKGPLDPPPVAPAGYGGDGRDAGQSVAAQPAGPDKQIARDATV